MYTRAYMVHTYPSPPQRRPSACPSPKTLPIRDRAHVFVRTYVYTLLSKYNRSGGGSRRANPFFGKVGSCRYVVCVRIYTCVCIREPGSSRTHSRRLLRRVQRTRAAAVQHPCSFYRVATATAFELRAVINWRRRGVGLFKVSISFSLPHLLLLLFSAAVRFSHVDRLAAILLLFLLSPPLPPTYARFRAVFSHTLAVFECEKKK